MCNFTPHLFTERQVCDELEQLRLCGALVPFCSSVGGCLRSRWGQPVHPDHRVSITWLCTKGREGVIREPTRCPEISQLFKQPTEASLGCRLITALLL